MTEHNKHIPTLLDAVFALESVPGTELERQSLTYKVQALYRQGRTDLEGVALIDELTDDELIAAIAIRDPAIKLFDGPHICPFTFKHINHNRPGVIRRADDIRLCR